MNRHDMLATARDRREPWDMVIIGGGATGVGIAVDAATRGYTVLLLEKSDFGKGTSSRSTKLVHGGVRYLQQGNISLVMEALKERGILRLNAPHLVRVLPFIIPVYRWWETSFYGLGMKVYDALARRYSFGRSRILSKGKTIEAMPTLETKGLRGGVQYYDGQFDDARLLINLVQTAAEHGATLVNYAPVTGLQSDGNGRVSGVTFTDQETGENLLATARVVINAAGPFADSIRRMDRADVEAMVVPSQGIHLVLDREFLPGDTAMMIPRTSDGRVMFAIPWYDCVIVGTTDTLIEHSSLEPYPQEQEIDFIIETARDYLSKPLSRRDVKAAFAGIRPLVKTGYAGNTAALSRDHVIHIAESGLVTMVGGKWTTYRRMAEDCVNQAAAAGALAIKPCVTRDLHIHGYHPNPSGLGDLHYYGSDASAVEATCRENASWGERLHDRLPIRAGQVIWAARQEMARTVDDVLARRTRCLLFDARAAVEAAPRTAQLLANELGHDPSWMQSQVTDFTSIASRYLTDDAPC